MAYQQRHSLHKFWGRALRFKLQVRYVLVRGSVIERSHVGTVCYCRTCRCRISRSLGLTALAGDCANWKDVLREFILPWLAQWRLRKSCDHGRGQFPVRLAERSTNQSDLGNRAEACPSRARRLSMNTFSVTRVRWFSNSMVWQVGDGPTGKEVHWHGCSCFFSWQLLPQLFVFY